MTSIKLIKKANILGELSFRIVDGNYSIILDNLGSDEFYATTVFDRIKKQLELGGDLSNTEVVKEFSKEDKTEIK